MASDTIIETRDLTKTYGPYRAVNGLNITVKPGEIFGFLGPNGAGKTTTLLMLLGLSRPSKGSARVCGLDPSRHPLKIKRRVGYLPENVGFYGDMTAVESLHYVAALNGMGREDADTRIEEVLRLVGLEKTDRKKTGAFSRGMKQRLGFAEVIIKEPEILFLDEPTLGLDPEGAIQLTDLVQSLNRDRKITVLLSSHNLYQVQRISHRVGIMIDGNLVADGSIESLAEEKFGVGEREYTLEEIYMKYFQEV